MNLLRKMKKAELLTHGHAASAAWPIPVVSPCSVAAVLPAVYASLPLGCPSSQWLLSEDKPVGIPKALFSYEEKHYGIFSHTLIVYY